jgi:ATPase subunit of ABC transporter with duplicated ATPase domains
MQKSANDRHRLSNNFRDAIIAACTQKTFLNVSALSVLQLDDTALQLYKGGDYGAYLDLEASINEQQEEFEGFHER